MDHKAAISRRRFLQLCGSVLAGASIVGVSGILLHKRWGASAEALPSSPYRLVSSFRTPGDVEALTLVGDRLLVAISDRVYTYDRLGNLLESRLRQAAGEPVASTHSPGITYTDEGVYCTEGESRRLLLDGEALGDARAVRGIQVSRDKVFVASRNLVSTFQYDKALAAKTACAGCGVDCPFA